MSEEKTKTNIPHSVILDNRKSVSVDGVCDVDSFDEKTIVISTEMGELIIKGDNLHINNLNTTSGNLQIDGKIDSLTYTDKTPSNSSLLSKIFR